MDAQTIFFLVIGLIYLGQWLIKHAANAFGGSEPGRAPDSEEERLRKFMEALGQKPGKPPVRQAPPPVPLAPVTGNLRRAPVPPPKPVAEKPWFEDEGKFPTAFVHKVEDLPREVQTALARIESGSKFEGGVEEGNPWQGDVRRRPKPEGTSATDLRQMFGTRDGLKRAIVAQEILGVPVSLRG